MTEGRRPGVSQRASVLAAVMAVSVGMTACAKGEDDTRRGGPAWLAENVTPTTVRIALDTASAVRQVITERGGSISAVGADGASYTLEVPDGALLAPERIVMTPVSRVDGLPLKEGAAAAVHLEPSGLRLLKPATLTIATTRPVPSSELLAFAYSGMGRDAHSYPARGDSTQVTIDVLHFSGYGFGRANPGDPAWRAMEKACDLLARLQARIASIFARERAAQLRGAADDASAASLNDVWKSVEPLFIDYYDVALRPLLKTVETDVRGVSDAIVAYLSWERQIQLVGGDTDDAGEISRRSAEGRRSIDIAVRNLLEKAPEYVRAECKRHNLEAVGEVIAAHRLAALLGIEGSDALAELIEGGAGCRRFELDFRSTMEKDTKSHQAQLGSGLKYRFAGEVVATVPIDSGVSREVPLRFSRLEMSGTVVLTEKNTMRLAAVGSKPGSLRVLRIDLNTNPKPPPAPECTGDGRYESRATASGDSASTDSVAGYVTLLMVSPVEVVRTTSALGTETAVSDNPEWHQEFWVSVFGSDGEEQLWKAAEEAQALVPQTREATTVPPYVFTLPLLKSRTAGEWRSELPMLIVDETIGRTEVVLRHRP